MEGEGIDPEIFDRLQRAMASDPNGFTDLYRDYLADARRTLAELKQALAENDAEQLRSHAHYLKGSSQITGIQEVAKRCAALEGSVPGNVAETRQLVRQIADALEAVQHELTQRLGQAVIPAGETTAL